jgi:hypothetical protein
MVATTPKIICHDLDETMGYFRSLSYELKGNRVPSYESPVTLRQEMREVLEKLKSEGKINVVTSAATTRYIEEALNRTNIRNCFEAIFDRNSVMGIYGKKYMPVAEQFELTPAEAESKVMVFGNSMDDAPEDIPIVFVNQHNGYMHPASIQQRIIERLEQENRDDFSEAFKSLMEKGTMGGAFLNSRMKVGGKQANLYYSPKYRSTPAVPTIDILDNAT